MDLQSILKAVQAATASAESVAALISAAKTVLTADEQAEIQPALDKLQAANDALHDRVQNKLRGG